MLKTKRSLVCWGLLVLLTPSRGLAADGDWQFASTPSFSVGKYGTGTPTEVFHTPISARRLFNSGDVTLVFPFECIRGNGVVTVVDGSPTRTETGGRGDSVTTGRGISTPSVPPGPVLGQVVTNCGLGDIIVRGRYYVVDEHGWMPTVAVRGHVKAPTANAELGTGRPDEGVGVEVSRALGGGVMVMVDGGYTIIGEPTGVEYNNNWWFDVGIAKDLANGAVNLSLFYDEDRAIVPGFPNARDILAGLSVGSSAGWRFHLSGQFGLSDGAPSHGFALGASRRF